ncbi:MAG: hypothetical protein U5N26_10535 [Candidatus Marinimicrobia bacterium]|nr:hypothetical protein [Candidatus Neomarinimicrobiota bacterium]
MKTDAGSALQRQADVEHIAGMTEPQTVPENLLLKKAVNENITDCSRLLRYAEHRAKFQHCILISDGQSYLGEALENIALKGRYKGLYRRSGGYRSARHPGPGIRLLSRLYHGEGFSETSLGVEESLIKFPGGKCPC